MNLGNIYNNYVLAVRSIVLSLSYMVSIPGLNNGDLYLKKAKHYLMTFDTWFGLLMLLYLDMILPDLTPLCLFKPRVCVSKNTAYPF